MIGFAPLMGSLDWPINSGCAAAVSNNAAQLAGTARAGHQKALVLPINETSLFICFPCKAGIVPGLALRPGRRLYLGFSFGLGQPDSLSAAAISLSGIAVVPIMGTTIARPVTSPGGSAFQWLRERWASSGVNAG